MVLVSTPPLGYVQVSGYNPESDVLVQLGHSYWVLFVLPSAVVVMLSVPHLDTYYSHGCVRGSLELFQETHDTGDREGQRTPGTSSSCFVPLATEPSDLSVTRVTVNGSAVANDQWSLSTPGSVTAPRREKTNSGNSPACSLKPVWKACGTSPPDPMLSDRSLRLHVKLTYTEVNYAEGFRSIFTFHQVHFV